MTADFDNKEPLVLALTRQVTQQDEAPYPELRTALETLIESVCGAGKPPNGVDWAAIVSEATTLRPHHD